MIKLNEIQDVKTSKNPIIRQMSQYGHEQVVFCQDQKTGLNAIIAIHSTVLGPALGGTRMWNYSTEQDALEDVLRLSRGMTFKASISGLDLGGGKAVIIGDAKTKKTDDLMRRFGEFVESLNGNYVTAEDVGMTPHDMEMIRQKTKNVSGIPKELGGSGDPSPVTAYGVYLGMKASAKYKWGSDSLTGKRILVQGVGHVGMHLVKYLSKEGAVIYVTDINSESLAIANIDYGAFVIEEGLIYDLDIDIYAPCALGATLNDFSSPRLKCDIVAGAANNQLAEETIHAKMLQERGILYAPDFLINAGGLVSVYSELKGYDEAQIFSKTEAIYDTTLSIYKKSDEDGVTTHEAAKQIAQERIDKVLSN